MVGEGFFESESGMFADTFDYKEKDPDQKKHAGCCYDDEGPECHGPHFSVELSLINTGFCFYEVAGQNEMGGTSMEGTSMEGLAFTSSTAMEPTSAVRRRLFSKRSRASAGCRDCGRPIRWRSAFAASRR